MPFEGGNSDRALLEELGAGLRATRLERNLTQQEVASEAGVGRATVQRLEEGESASLTSLVRVLRALGETDGLRRLLPAPAPSPIEELKREGGRRRRARTPPPDRKRPRPWRWGDEEPGGRG